MKNYFILLIFAIIVSINSANATGLIFTQATHPLSATCLPLCDMCCYKEGKATTLNLLYLFEFGDGGIDAAACNGCIQQIYYVNQTESSFLFFFKKLTTTVYGK